MEIQEMEKNTMRLSSVAIDSDFVYFLEKNFPSSAMILSKEDAKEDSVYYVIQRFQERYNIWKKIPEWIKNYYGGTLPPEVFTIHEPYEHFVMTFEDVMMRSSVPQASVVNNLAYSDEYAKKVISSCEDAGYSMATAAKLVDIYARDKELFESGKISSPEGKFVHKVHNLERLQVIEEAMSPEREVLHSLKELRRIEAKCQKEEDEAVKEKLEKERQEIIAYMAKKALEVENVEIVELLANELDKIKENKDEIGGAIKRIKEAITPKKEEKVGGKKSLEEAKVDNKKDDEKVKEETKGVEASSEIALKVVAESGDAEKSVVVEKEEKQNEITEGSKEERRLKAVSKILGSLGEIAKEGEFAALSKELTQDVNELKSEDKSFRKIVEKIDELAPENGYFSRKIRDRKFDKRERIYAKKIINGEECDLSEMFEKKRKDGNISKISKALARLGMGGEGEKEEEESEKKELNTMKRSNKGDEFSL